MSNEAEPVDEVGQIILFRIEWPDLLCAGPRSISMMGACFLSVHASDPTLSIQPAVGQDQIM